MLKSKLDELDDDVKKMIYDIEQTFYDGEEFIIFHINKINFENKTIQVAVTNRGKISVIEYDLFQDGNGDFYFEYGVMLEKIYLENFETIGEF